MKKAKRMRKNLSKTQKEGPPRKEARRPKKDSRKQKRARRQRARRMMTKSPSSRKSSQKKKMSQRVRYCATASKACGGKGTVNCVPRTRISKKQKRRSTASKNLSEMLERRLKLRRIGSRSSIKSLKTL